MVESGWCRSEYASLLVKEIQARQTNIQLLKLNDCEIPSPSYANYPSRWTVQYNLFEDLREGLTDAVLEEIEKKIVDGASMTRFKRLMPSGAQFDPTLSERMQPTKRMSKEHAGYKSSVLAMIISSTLKTVPVASLSRETVLIGHSLSEVYQSVDTLIERFQNLCDEIVENLVEGGIKSYDPGSIYGSARRLGRAKIRAAKIATDMREIATSISEMLPKGSNAREQFSEVLQICASISVAEDFLIVEFGAPLDISVDRDEHNNRWIPDGNQLSGVAVYDSCDNSEKLDEYPRLLTQLDAYRTRLRSELARVADVDTESGPVH